MPTQVTIAGAHDQLSAHHSAGHGAPVVITRRGLAVVAIVSAEAFERLQRLRVAGSQAGLAGGWEGSEDLLRELDARHRGPPRPSPAVD